MKDITEKINELNADSSTYFEKDERLHSMLFGRLTCEQKKAVFMDNESSLLIVAGPGTGKTATLTSRIVRFLLSGYSPILALTFTRKAANELKSRVSMIYSSSSKSIYSKSKHLKNNLHNKDLTRFTSTPEIFIGTIHSFCWKLLKEYGTFIGLPKDISIMDKEIAIKLLRSCISESLGRIPSQISDYSFIFDPSNLDEIERDDFDDSQDDQISDETQSNKADDEQFKKIDNCLTHLKKEMDDRGQVTNDTELEKILKIIKLMKIKKYINNIGCTIDDFNGNNELFRVYCSYTKKMTSHKPYLLDYTDLIILTLKLLENNIKIKEKIQCSYPYIFCDEFQDTSKLQLKILEFLAISQNIEKNTPLLIQNKGLKVGGITVVGDDDQAIYSWRGVDSGVFLQFSSTFKKNFSLVYLTKNFRSSKSITNAANHLIEKNKHRIVKSLSSDNRIGIEPVVCCFSKQTDEVQWIASTIILLRIKFNYSWSDFAILARTNDTLFYIEKLFNDRQFIVSCLEVFQDIENITTERNWSKMISNDLLDFDVNQLNQYKTLGTVFPLENTSRNYLKSTWDLLNKTEILDILSYCRLIIDETADDCFLRVCNRPKRGIGMKAIKLIEELGAKGISLLRKSTQPLNGICELNNNSNQEKESSYISIMSVCRMLLSDNLELRPKIDYKLHKKTIHSIGLFLEYVDNLKQFIKNKVSVPEIINMIVKNMNVDKTDNSKCSKKIKISPDSNYNISNNIDNSVNLRRSDVSNVISALIKYSEPYTPNEQQPTGYECLLCFLQDASNGLLQMKKKEKISLSTVHKAKGLEWKVVFIPKFVDKVFPLHRESESTMLNNEINEIVSEEERRIAYVAFTRAKERLFISVPLNVSKPSPFIQDANLYFHNKASKEKELIKQFPRIVRGVNWKKS